MNNNPIYQNYLQLWDLYGPSYDVIKRACFYIMICHANRYKPLFFGKEKIDQRLNAFFIMPSGSGKKFIYHILRRSVEGLNTCNCQGQDCNNQNHIRERFANCQRPHPDHLVGKKLIEFVPNPGYQRGGGQPRYQQQIRDNYGYLHSDFCAFDECHSLVTKEDKEECQQYLRTATDTMLSNQLVKQRVDISFQRPLSYYPECTCVFLMQPHPIDQAVITAGLLRRGLIIYVEPTLEEIQTGINSKIVQGATHTPRQIRQQWTDWTHFLRQCRQRSNINAFRQGVVSFTFSVRMIQIVIEKSDWIVERLIQRSVGVTRYLNQSMISDIKKNIMRMSCVNATINNRTDIIEPDIAVSAEDLFAFCVSANDYVENYVEAKIMLREELQEMLLFLEERRATNRATSITMPHFLQQYSMRIKKPVSSIKKNQLRILINRGFIQVYRGAGGGVALTEEGARFAGLEVTP
jgi:hypothetical protein